MNQNVHGSVAAFPDISELFPLASGQAYCYIHVLKKQEAASENEVINENKAASENKAAWIYALYEDKSLDFYYIARLPYLPRENAAKRIWAILPGIIGNSRMLIVEGIQLLNENDQKFILSRLSEYSIQNGIVLIVIPPALLSP